MKKVFNISMTKRRIGRPRLHWVRETMKNTFSKLYNDEIYIEDDEEIIFRLLCAAEIEIVKARGRKKTVSVG